ncbi:Fanconi anemia core complex-associated protein 24-like isoform X2 [Gigantopelta aegis]|uniref:Fanconi anemia core complex-associated protein 24-like isoform X2 n=1 Tax=Gigantopelta aegis TaxID=1735272 RepID=UPI001B88AE80|nr:Fanconi anemia core complex-associated protein 24-like isoform X2 [Gigantopelta aegis]
MDSQRPVKTEINVPTGHIVISGRWRTTELTDALLSSVRVHYDDNLGVVDFHTSSHTGVIYVSESDMVTASGYRRKLVMLRKANSVRGVIIAEKTTMSSQYYSDLQRFCVLEIGFVLLPVTNQTEAAGLLAQMVHCEGKQESNPFLRRRLLQQVDPALVMSLQKVPKLGQVKALQLLEAFHSLRGICEASTEALSKIVGAACARNVKQFFDNT